MNAFSSAFVFFAHALTKAAKIACIALISSATVAHAAEAASQKSAADPASTLQALVAVFGHLKTPHPDAPLTPADKAYNQTHHVDIDPYFARETILNQALKPHKKQLSAAQQAEFKDAFWQLIRIMAYPHAGAFLRGQAWEITQNKPIGKTGAKLTVEALLPDDDIETEVTFVWQRAGQKTGQKSPKPKPPWQIVDASIDGASIVVDMQNQLGRILKEHGPEGLLRKLQKRLKSAQK